MLHTLSTYNDTAMVACPSGYQATRAALSTGIAVSFNLAFRGWGKWLSINNLR